MDRFFSSRGFFHQEGLNQVLNNKRHFYYRTVERSEILASNGSSVPEIKSNLKEEYKFNSDIIDLNPLLLCVSINYN